MLSLGFDQMSQNPKVQYVAILLFLTLKDDDNKIYWIGKESLQDTAIMKLVKKVESIRTELNDSCKFNSNKVSTQVLYISYHFPYINTACLLSYIHRRKALCKTLRRV